MSSATVIRKIRSTCRRMKLYPYLSPCTKLSSKLAKYLRNPASFRGENIKYASIYRYRKEFFIKTPVAQKLRSKIYKQNLMNLKASS